MTEELARNQNLRRLYAVRLFIVRCILPDKYHFPQELDEAIVLTSAGNAVLSKLIEDNPSRGGQDAKAAVLAEFVTSGELLIDYEKTSFDTLREILSPDIRNGVIRYPWVYDDSLETAYIAAFGQREPPNYLEYTDTLKILEKLPQGVFQVADVTVGPFGMLQVVQERCVPPSLCGPEIECADPGCRGIHHVVLSTGTTDAGEAFQSIPSPPRSYAIDKLIADLVRPDEQYYRADNDWGLPWLLMSGLTPAEARALLARLLATNVGGIREFANKSLSAQLTTKSAIEISHAVTDAEICQMFLTVTNDSLVTSMEEMIATGEIAVGQTETREPIRSRHAEGGRFRAKAQISRLGVRFLPNRNLASLRLRAFILALYKDGSRSELSWLLRDQPGDADLMRLENFLTKAPASEIISRLVLATRERVLDAFKLLHYGKFALPGSAQSESNLIEKILWKLGDSLKPPPCSEDGVINRLEIFRRISAQEADRSDLSIDSVRSAGVNMFVAFEALMAEVVDYVCWLLLFDHYQGNRDMRFIYRPGLARGFARPLIASRNNESFSFDIGGRNTLGTLAEALGVIADLAEVAIADSASSLSEHSDVPFLLAHSGIYEFPFRHTTLILDLEESSSGAVISALRSARTELDAASVVDVRNRLSHARPTFPSNDDVVRATGAVERTIAVLGGQGLLPTVYMRVGREIDSFGRVFRAGI